MKKLIPLLAAALVLAGGILLPLLFLKSERSLARDAWHLKPPLENAAEMIAVLPSARQLAHAETEFYAFFHFGINTFYEVEWGTGGEDPMRFDPTNLDTDQWAASIAAAVMKGAIITAKHHDGFCLWPSAYTEFSVKNSPYQGDVVGEMAESCRKYGLKFGFYLSPWDMNAPTFGQDEAYNDYYAAQLTELLTNYGDVFAVWLDGAIGEEYKDRQTYDFPRWTEIIRELQPDACITIMGSPPDVAWVGNEHGLADGNVSSVGRWGLVWTKNECDVSIRPGWFYHADQQPKSLKQLIHIYYNSVGMNCTLLLNIPPNKEGLLDQQDVDRLAEFGEAIRAIYANEIPTVMTPLTEDGGMYAYDLKLDARQKVKHLVLSEDVENYSERVTRFSVYAKVGGFYVKAGQSQSAGAKTIVQLSRFAPRTDTYRVVIEEARGEPAAQVKLYGGGAAESSPGRPANPRIDRAADELLGRFEAYEEYPGYAGQGSERAAIWTDKSLKNFRYIEVGYEIAGDEIILHPGKTLHSIAELTPGRPFVTTFWVPEIIPVNGIAFTGSDGRHGEILHRQRELRGRLSAAH